MIIKIIGTLLFILVFFMTWVLMRSASITDREYEELSRRKFFGEEGISSE